MGSFSSKKENDSDSKKATEQAVAAAKPNNYSDPFGTLTTKNKTTTFKPTESQQQIDTRNQIDASINNIVGQVPTSFDVESYYNNPFYDTTKRMYDRVIDQQRERDTKDLNNNLNARNQIGSSYDALANRYLNQDYATQYAQADDQSRLASANAYQQAYQNLLASLSGLSNERTSSLDRLYAPAKIATGYQSAIAPLQQSQAAAYNNLANYYGGRTTGAQVVTDLTKSVLGSAGQAAAAYYGAV